LAQFRKVAGVKVPKKQTRKPSTVDGSEIRRYNQLMDKLPHWFTRFFFISGGCLGFLPSTVTSQPKALVHWAKAPGRLEAFLQEK